MSIKEVRQALGNWGITLRPDTPRELIQVIEANKFGHIAIVPGRVNPKMYGDALLREARYVGVYRSTFKQSDDTIEIKGAGMAFWLGDEDDKGDVFETPVVLTAQSFANSVRALLPPNGAVREGTLYTIPGSGTYTGRHQWETPRQAITYVTDTYSSGGSPVEFRVNGDGTLDAGPIENLYNVTSPKAILVKRDSGRDMRLLGLKADMSMDYDVEDLTTRIVLLAQGEGDTIATGFANAAPFPYKNLFGDPIKQTRLVSESETAAGNANARAELQLIRWSTPRQAIQIRTEEFDIKGDFVVGDYIYVFDPEAGFFDLDNEVFWRGQPINPIALRVTEMDWNVRADWTVGFRTNNGDWLDLSEYYKPDGGGSTLAVGDYRRTLAGNNYESLGFRPNLPQPGADSTVPGVPAFTGFSVGSYQTDITGTVKAAIRAQWNEPLNVDGSTVTDGSHYEIRYRVNEVFGYKISWDAIAAYDWDSVGSWDAPLSEPIEASPQWTLINVPWDMTVTTIMDLSPGATYEIQIRGVDSATPPNRGAWSGSEFVNTVGDIFAPATPATPTVASSQIAIQVIHYLGKASGGTFNLELDLSHLEVHVGGSESFLADATTKVGELIATGGMVSSSIPAVGTFKIDNTDDIYVKVVAVDLSGNRSSASVAVQSSVDLIDNAHISDLSVSKVTAGTITATWIMAGSIKTGETGARVELNSLGLKAYNTLNEPTVEISSTTGAATFTGTIKTDIDTGGGISLIPGPFPTMLFSLRDPEGDVGDHRVRFLGYNAGDSFGQTFLIAVEDISGPTTQDGAKFLFSERANIISHQPNGGDEAYLALGGFPVGHTDNQYGRIFMQGRFSDGYALNGETAMWTSVTSAGSGFSGISFAYGATMSDAMAVVASVSGVAGDSSCITSPSSSGFTVSWNGSPARTAYVWAVRVDT